MAARTSGRTPAAFSLDGGNHSRGEPCPSRTGKGVVTQTESRDGGFAGVSQIHLSRQARWPPELLVTGCYHHSQLREALIGGVSRELLQHMTVPVLMSH